VHPAAKMKQNMTAIARIIMDFLFMRNLPVEYNESGIIDKLDLKSKSR
jgi:hypothetical protein